MKQSNNTVLKMLKTTKVGNTLMEKKIRATVGQI
jgi:hypothetical protein